MTKLHIRLIGALLLPFALASCQDNTLSIGTSLTETSDQLELVSNNFTVQTRTIVPDSVLSRSNECYFGKIKDPETGVYVTSEFMTQFNVLESFQIDQADSVANRFDGMAGADSCRIDLYIASQSACSDSLAAMKIRLVEMAEPAEEDFTYYSNFDPVARGLVRQGGLEKTLSFSYSSLPMVNGFHVIRLYMNEPYTDTAGKTYNNYGTYLMQQYYSHPEYFRNAYQFIRRVCPGFCFQIVDGMGFHAKISNIGMTVSYTLAANEETGTDETPISFTFAATNEVLQTTRISNDKSLLQQLAQDNTCTYIKSPAGLFTEVELPIDDILLNHEKDSVLSAKLVFERLNNTQHDFNNLDIPQNLLLVQKDSLEAFFLKNKLTDNVTSYLNSTSTLSKTNTYTFDNISELISLIAEQKQKGQAADSQWTANHPDWNKAVLVPITLVQTTTSSSYYGSSSTTTGIKHNMSLTSTRLVGGTNNPRAPIQLQVVYGKFK